ncbi:hypothetical protein ACQEVB_34130 [Pseudonocardia sp. CA-107938]|uniref:hypothetical protein n=1 Tax=Pseudonocardia sp. CA-107938 TaxID=3240021 RepID=UPI003D93F674
MSDHDATDVLPVVAAEPDDLVDEGWDAPARKTSKLTLLLVGGVVVALGFGAGVLVQKNHDASVLGGALRGRPAAAAGASSARGPVAGPPVVVGTVSALSGTSLTVTDLGGTAVQVSVPATATVTTAGLGHPEVGDPVSVSGTKGPDGAVTATAVTVRPSTG